MPAGVRVNDRIRNWACTRFLGDDTCSEAFLAEHVSPHCSWFVGQLETCPTTGNVHLQCAFVLKSRDGWTRATVMRRMPFFEKGHLNGMIGTPQQNRVYCTKPDTRLDGPWEIGQLSGPGGRDVSEKHTLEMAMDMLKEYGGPANLCRNCPVIYAKFHRQLEAAWVYLQPKEVFDEFQPRPWQQQVLDLVEGEVHNRHVHWIVDVAGGKGKTYLARYLVSVKNAFYCTGGKSADVIYAFAQDPKPVVIFDYTRETQDFVNYSVIETLKNGIVFSGKYNSKSVSFPVPHLICFSNFHPDQSKLSRDRWQIKVLEDETTPPFL